MADVFPLKGKARCNTKFLCNAYGMRNLAVSAALSIPGLRNQCIFNTAKALLKIRVGGGAGMELHVADVGNAGEVHDGAREAHAVARVTAGAVAA